MTPDQLIKIQLDNLVSLTHSLSLALCYFVSLDLFLFSVPLCLLLLFQTVYRAYKYIPYVCLAMQFVFNHDLEHYLNRYKFYSVCNAFVVAACLFFIYIYTFILYNFTCIPHIFHFIAFYFISFVFLAIIIIIIITITNIMIGMCSICD